MSYASGSIFSGFVSSNLRTRSPPYLLTYSSLRIDTLVWPMCSGPDGPGAMRMTTFPSTFLSSGSS